MKNTIHGKLQKELFTDDDSSAEDMLMRCIVCEKMVAWIDREFMMMRQLHPIAPLPHALPDVKRRCMRRLLNDLDLAQKGQREAIIKAVIKFQLCLRQLKICRNTLQELISAAEHTIQSKNEYDSIVFNVFEYMAELSCMVMTDEYVLESNPLQLPVLVLASQNSMVDYLSNTIGIDLDWSAYGR